MSKIITIFALILLVMAVLIIAPWFTLTALNTLFGLNIAYNFWTWLSILWLGIVFGGGAAAASKN